MLWIEAQIELCDEKYCKKVKFNKQQATGLTGEITLFAQEASKQKTFDRVASEYPGLLLQACYFLFS